jgi:hypothetical protein
MFQHLLLGFFVILAIVAVNLWHLFSSWLVHTHGIIPGLVVLGVILLLSRLIPE